MVWLAYLRLKYSDKPLQARMENNRTWKGGSPSDARPASVPATPAAGRWPLRRTLAFVVVSSLALWALIVAAVLRLA